MNQAEQQRIDGQSWTGMHVFAFSCDQSRASVQAEGDIRPQIKSQSAQCVFREGRRAGQVLQGQKQGCSVAAAATETGSDGDAFFQMKAQSPVFAADRKPGAGGTDHQVIFIGREFRIRTGEFNLREARSLAFPGRPDFAALYQQLIAQVNTLHNGLQTMQSMRPFAEDFQMQVDFRRSEDF